MMRAANWISFLALVCLPCWVDSASARNGGSIRRRINQDAGCPILCEIEVVNVMYSAQDRSVDYQGDSLHQCLLKNDVTPSRVGYRIKLPSYFLDWHGDQVAAGGARVCISDGNVDREKRQVIIDDESKISILSQKRKLQTVEPLLGSRKVMAVQLKTTSVDSSLLRVFEDPGLTTAEIEGSVFGTGPNAEVHGVASQFKDCSFGKLNVEPASGTNIVNGVAQVEIGMAIANKEVLGAIQDAILEATELVVGNVDQFDHIFFCVPDNGHMDGSNEWTAFTYFHSHWSFFQKRRCNAMSVLLHELGHNFGFRHSGYMGDLYGDETGYMGYTVNQQGSPLRCFNGHKHWVAGWFHDRQFSADPLTQGSILTRLAAFIDYDKSLEWYDLVLLQVGTYYIQYNRAKGINVGTGLHQDKVTITHANDDLSDSDSVAALAAGEAIELLNYLESGLSLIVKACKFGTVGSAGSFTSSNLDSSGMVAATKSFTEDNSSFDYVWISIHVNDGVQQSQCDHIGDLDHVLNPRANNIQAQPVEKSATLRPTAAPSSRRVWASQAEYYQLERLQKKRYIPEAKDYMKLVKEDPEPTRRLRLKGS